MQILVLSEGGSTGPAGEGIRRWLWTNLAVLVLEVLGNPCVHVCLILECCSHLPSLPGGEGEGKSDVSN